jgi:hypothetical protein
MLSVIFRDRNGNLWFTWGKTPEDVLPIIKEKADIMSQECIIACDY